MIFVLIFFFHFDLLLSSFFPFFFEFWLWVSNSQKQKCLQHLVRIFQIYLKKKKNFLGERDVAERREREWGKERKWRSKEKKEEKWMAPRENK